MSLIFLWGLTMKKDDQPLRFATRAIHAGQSPEPVTGAVMTPIFQTSTYAQKEPGNPIGKYEYSRTQNPTRDALEQNLASLEKGRFGFCFASGCAALTALLQGLKPGDHVLLSDDVYGGTFRIFEKIFKPFGIQYSIFDFTHLERLPVELKSNTRLIWIETPSNPVLKGIDIKRVCQFVKSKDPLIHVAVDNTFATPYYQQPLELGADIVAHSTTKYLGGHSDVVGGALIVNDPILAEQLSFIQNATGAIPGPMDSFLLLRSIKTLPLRMDKHSENALRIAKFLETHPKIERVIYPGLPCHPQHALFCEQMSGFGGMISVILKGDLHYCKSFMSALKLFTLAESLGGVESLIEHPGIMTHATIPKEQREKLGIVDGLVRLSVGIEDDLDLIEDLDQALNCQ